MAFFPPLVIRVRRRIAADPATLARLLAGSSAVELWPGTRHVTGSAGRLRISTDIPGRGLVELCIHLSRPLSSPTSFVTAFVIASDSVDVPPLAGVFRLRYHTTAAGDVDTDASLVFD